MWINFHRSLILLITETFPMFGIVLFFGFYKQTLVRLSFVENKNWSKLCRKIRHLFAESEEKSARSMHIYMSLVAWAGPCKMASNSHGRYRRPGRRIPSDLLTRTEIIDDRKVKATPEEVAEGKMSRRRIIPFRGYRLVPDAFTERAAAIGSSDFRFRSSKQLNPIR